jgi:hypothetical protein
MTRRPRRRRRRRASIRQNPNINRVCLTRVLPALLPHLAMILTNPDARVLPLFTTAFHPHYSLAHAASSTPTTASSVTDAARSSSRTSNFSSHQRTAPANARYGRSWYQSPVVWFERAAIEETIARLRSSGCDKGVVDMVRRSTVVPRPPPPTVFDSAGQGPCDTLRQRPPRFGPFDAPFDADGGAPRAS